MLLNTRSGGRFVQVRQKKAGGVPSFLQVTSLARLHHLGHIAAEDAQGVALHQDPGDAGGFERSHLPTRLDTLAGRRYAYSKVGVTATTMLLFEPVSAAVVVGSMLDSSATVVAQQSPQVAAQSPARSLLGSRSSGLPGMP